MGVKSPAWRILDTVFRCRTAPSEAVATIAQLLAGFETVPTSASNAVDFELDVGPGSTGCLALVISNHESGRRGRFTVRSAEQVEYILVREAVNRSEDYIVLHAAAVLSGTGACLIVGPAGTGKTSLALHLRVAGLALLSDDLSPFRRGSSKVEVFPRALHFDGDYTPELQTSLSPAPAGYPSSHRPFPRWHRRQPHRVARILVLEPERAGDGVIVPLSRSQCAHHLLAAVIRNPRFDFAESMGFVSRLASQAEAHLLRANSELEARRAALALLAPHDSAGHLAARR